jgi:hypothetical protein
MQNSNQHRVVAGQHGYGEINSGLLHKPHGLPPELAFRTKDSWPLALSLMLPLTGSRSTSSGVTRRRATSLSSGSSARLRGRAYVLRVPSSLPVHPGKRHRGDLRGGGDHAAVQQASLGAAVGRDRLEGRSVVRLGLVGHHLPAPLPVVRGHVQKGGELAFHCCYVPDEQVPLATGCQLIRL